MISKTSTQYKEVISACQELFAKKTRDYGTAWRVLRLPSITDQIYIKAWRIRQIQETLGISSTSVVAYNLKALEGKGMLKREGKVSRGITIPQTTPARLSRKIPAAVPLLGVITAGQPLPDPEDTSGRETEMI